MSLSGIDDNSIELITCEWRNKVDRLSSENSQLRDAMREAANLIDTFIREREVSARLDAARVAQIESLKQQLRIAMQTLNSRL